MPSFLRKGVLGGLGFRVGASWIFFSTGLPRFIRHAADAAPGKGLTVWGLELTVWGRVIIGESHGTQLENEIETAM